MAKTTKKKGKRGGKRRSGGGGGMLHGLKLEHLLGGVGLVTYVATTDGGRDALAKVPGQPDAAALAAGKKGIPPLLVLGVGGLVVQPKNKYLRVAAIASTSIGIVQLISKRDGAKPLAGSQPDVAALLGPAEPPQAESSAIAEIEY